MEDLNWMNNLALEECFASVLSNAFNSDIDLIVRTGKKTANGQDERKLHAAHTFMLTLRSSFFTELIESAQASGHGQRLYIQVDGILEQDFLPILNYLYTDDSKILNQHNIVGIYTGAKIFRLEHLSEKCIELTKFNVNKGKHNTHSADEILLDFDNIFDLLNVAQQYEDPNMIKNCWYFIDINLEALLDWTLDKKEKKLDKEFFGKLLERETNTVIELGLFECLDKWAVGQCQDENIENPTGSQKRAKIGDLIYKIRFPLMHLEEFTEHIVPTEVLSTEEMVAILIYYTNKEHPQPFDATPRGYAEPTVLIDKYDADVMICQLREKVMKLNDQEMRMNLAR